VERRLSSHRPRRPPTGTQRSVLTPTTEARRRNSSPPLITAIFSKASATAAAQTPAAKPGLGDSRGPEQFINYNFRITIRSREPSGRGEAPARAIHQPPADLGAPVHVHNALLAPGANRHDAFSRSGIFASSSPFLLFPPTTATSLRDELVRRNAVFPDFLSQFPPRSAAARDCVPWHIDPRATPAKLRTPAKAGFPRA